MKIKAILLSFLLVLVSFSASAVTEPVTPPKETPPTLPPIPPSPTALLGEFDLEFWNGSVNQDGQIGDLRPVAFRVSVYDSSRNDDGAEWYYGSIAGHRGSHVTIEYNPGRQKNKITVWVFMPQPPLGWFSGYYLQVESPLFITSPDSASGAMLARFEGEDETIIIYHSDVSLCRVGACKG